MSARLASGRRVAAFAMARRSGEAATVCGIAVVTALTNRILAVISTTMAGFDPPDVAPPRRFPTDALGYTLPASLIAQHPTGRREDARMLVIERQTGALRDDGIANLPRWLLPGDLLVLNDTKVLPAKFTARRTTGGVVSGLFVAEESPGKWRVMLRGSKRLRVGENLVAPANSGEPVVLTLEVSHGEGQWQASVRPAETPEVTLARIGRAPLPPYIHRDADSPQSQVEDLSRYQTVYAQSPGAIAAPTAGLHLTDALLQQLDPLGVATAFVTLHVGVGTFKPVTVDDLSEHLMHAERYVLSEQASAAVQSCRDRCGRVVAVGTTSVRVLESAAARSTGDRVVEAGSGMTDLFIYPPYRFRAVDVLLTNFHLPRSSLLALVMAFAGPETTRQAYRHAVENRYRFYSYGDAMLIR